MQVSDAARIGAFSLMTSAIAACIAAPVEAPDVMRTPPAVEAPARYVSSATCTRRWNAAVDGMWDDAVRWKPLGVPTAFDTVCIQTAGSYVVTVRNAVPTVAVLQLGDSVSRPTLEVESGGVLNVKGAISNYPASTLALGTDVGSTVSCSHLYNEGTVRVLSSTSANASARIDCTYLMNYGALILAGRTTLNASGWSPEFRNSGTIVVTAPDPVHYAFTPTKGYTYVWMTAGDISGTQSLMFERGVGSGSFAHFNWTGGSIQPNSAAPSRSVVHVTNFKTATAYPASSGTVNVLGGGVNDTTDVEILSDSTHAIIEGQSTHFQLFDNIGTLDLLAVGSTYSRASVSLFSNFGTINVLRATTFDVTKLDNHGTIVLSANLTFSRPSGYLQNFGNVRVIGSRRLIMGSTTEFRSDFGTQVGTLQLSNASLTGRGTVGDIVSTGGSIRPGFGLTEPGTLSASSVTLDAASGVSIDLAGDTPGTYDQLAVAGSVTYGGKLAITSASTFIGGACGQVIPIITDQSTAGRGAFASTFGFAPLTFAHAWRAYNPTGSYNLAGFNPLSPLHATKISLAVTEGGASDSFLLCLGGRAPNANVKIVAGSLLGQSVATPTPAVFTVTDWMLPRTFTVSAINDVVVEAEVTDDLQLTVGSADPFYAALAIASRPVTVTDNDGNADLSISLVEVPASTAVGQVFDFTVVVTNNGRTLSTGGTITIPATGNFEVQSVVTAGCNWTTSYVTCPFTTTAVGATKVFVIFVRAIASGNTTITATVTGQQPDAVPANNSAAALFVAQ